MTGLILENVEKFYGSACAVQDVNLHLPEGKLVCFLGPSGCGKTTLLRMIAGLETLTGGEIRLDGENIGHTPARRPINRSISGPLNCSTSACSSSIPTSSNTALRQVTVMSI